MTRRFSGGIVGAVVTLGLLLALGVVGVRLAGSHSSTEPVERVSLLPQPELFREQSNLPPDLVRGIEQLFEDQARAISRLESRVAALDTRRLDSIERRLTSFERSLNALDTSGLGDLERELDSVRRGVEELSRTVGDIPRSDLSSVQRSLDELERELRRSIKGAIDSLQYDVRGLKSSLRGVEDKVRTLEQRIP